MDHESSGMHHVDNIDCNGVVMGHHGIHGSWFGHVAPGAVFIVWGLWHMLNVLVQYVSLQAVGQQQQFRSRSYYFLKARGYKIPIESILKLLVPLVGVSIELHLYSKEHYRALMCPKGTMHANGWFNAVNVNNWQHTTIYPAFVLSGIVDFVGMKVPLPPGTETLFFSLGFIIEAIIMGSHTKHIPLDQIVHQIFYATTAITSLLSLLETHFNYSFLLAASRTVFLVVQGTWICAIGRIMFEGRPQWEWQYQASYDLAPVLYCYHLLSALAFFFLCYVAVYMLYHKTQHRKYEHVKQHEEVDIEVADLSPRGEKDNTHA